MVRVFVDKDDLIVIKGDIQDKFSIRYDNTFLSFSDGTLLKVTRTKEEKWIVICMKKGNSLISAIWGNIAVEIYSDSNQPISNIIEINNKYIRWVVCGRFSQYMGYSNK